MSIRKITILTLLLRFFNFQSFAEIKTEKKFKMWESQYMNKGGKKVCFAVSMPTNMSPKNLSRAESRIFVDTAEAKTSSETTVINDFLICLLSSLLFSSHFSVAKIFEG